MTALAEAFELVKREIERQDAKWGEQNHAPAMWSLILGEEVGEASEAALHKNGPDYVMELTHVAAVAIQAATCAIRNGGI